MEFYRSVIELLVNKKVEKRRGLLPSSLLLPFLSSSLKMTKLRHSLSSVHVKTINTPKRLAHLIHINCKYANMKLSD